MQTSPRSSGRYWQHLSMLLLPLLLALLLAAAKKADIHNYPQH
jgi:hypothetical protein